MLLGARLDPFHQPVYVPVAVTFIREMCDQIRSNGGWVDSQYSQNERIIHILYAYDIKRKTAGDPPNTEHSVAKEIVH